MPKVHSLKQIDIYIYVCISGYLFVLKEKNRPYIFYYVYCTDKVDEWSVLFYSFVVIQFITMQRTFYAVFFHTKMKQESEL